ncbi:MAG: carboxypeptidase-like regulatory domain-containing protein [Acidobacteriota bacterium]|nr:carboxypeptidase-like regulatory domain-containing protein [Acidobacteriota bacterium]
MASAHQARIAGTIKDDLGTPIEGALVSVIGAMSSLAVTDRSGHFSLALPPGEYQIRVHSDGYSSTFREMVLLGAQASITRAIVLNRTGERTVLAAGLGGRAAIPSAGGSDPKAHPHNEQAWRLRHLRRTTLRDVTATADLDAEDQSAWETFGRAMASPARLASALFTDLPIDGEFRLLTAGSVGPYTPAFDELSGAGVAYLSVRSGIGSHGEWSARGTMSSADLGTWLVAGDYVTRADNTHAFTLGMSYGSQGIPTRERTPVPVATVLTDRTRNSGQIYAFDRWRVSPSVVLDYGTRVDYYDYLTDKSVLWSPIASFEITPGGETAPTSFRVAASSRRDAPGSAEFTPPAAGPWLPPQRVFTPLPGGGFDVERTDHAEVEVEHRFEEAYSIAVRRFTQRTGNQLATLFGLDRPGAPDEGGHYYVASMGDAAVDGWGLRLATPDGQPIRGSIEYAVAAVEWTPVADVSALVGPVARSADDRIHDITTSLGADVPQTKTRLFIVYRVSSGFATEDSGSTLGSRFDMQLNQGLPFLPASAGQWEMLLSMRNTLRDARFGMSILDELLAVSTPTRVVGGVQVKF